MAKSGQGWLFGGLFWSGENKLNDIDLFLLIESQQLYQPEEYLDGDDSVDGDKVYHLDIGGMVELFLNEVDLHYVKD